MKCCNALRHLPLLLLLNACTNSQPAGDAAATPLWTPPRAGTVVAADSMRIDDPLNEFYFAVKLVTSPANDSPGTQGYVYDMYLHSGPNTGMQQLTMPKGGAHLRPLLRRAKDGGTTFIIGFVPGKNFGGDTTFQEYYSVKAEGKNMMVKPLKSFSFQ